LSCFPQCWEVFIPLNAYVVLMICLLFFQSHLLTNFWVLKPWYQGDLNLPSSTSFTSGWKRTLLSMTITFGLTFGIGWPLGLYLFIGQTTLQTFLFLIFPVTIISALMILGSLRRPIGTSIRNRCLSTLDRFSWFSLGLFVFISWPMVIPLVFFHLLSSTLVLLGSGFLKMCGILRDPSYFSSLRGACSLSLAYVHSLALPFLDRPGEFPPKRKSKLGSRYLIYFRILVFVSTSLILPILDMASDVGYTTPLTF